ncbi:ATP-binding protein [Brevundimonas basaltis]|uniref:ATP-binding protein n=1 Tax=Brevundimonas basaltis TaxID=472166 RepID=UPI001FEA326D|nr:ATP-binding protein [Brevundimonas basaltis]
MASETSSDASHGLDVIHLDTSQEVDIVLSMLADLQADEGITSGIGEYKLTDDELGEVEFITRRGYRSVSLFEIEEFDRVIPFFEVSYGEDRYDSRSMGAGELAAFLIWWTLFRAKENSIILLEEPETFLSQASQEAVGSHILSKVTEKKLCAVVATHSGPMIAPMPDEALVFLIRTREGVSFDASAPPSLLTQLGIDPPISAIVLVEDMAGAEFCRWILEKYDPRLARRIDVTVRNGEGNIAASLAQMADTRRIKIVGLFDGDVRTTTAEEPRARSTFLPGDIPIERTFRTLVTENPGAFGAIVGREDIPRLLATLEGKEAHDWYHDLSVELGLSRTQLFPPMFRLWNDQDGSEEAARAVAKALSELIDGLDE